VQRTCLADSERDFLQERGGEVAVPGRFHVGSVKIMGRGGEKKQILVSSSSILQGEGDVEMAEKTEKKQGGGGKSNVYSVGNGTAVQRETMMGKKAGQESAKLSPGPELKGPRAAGEDPKEKKLARVPLPMTRTHDY